MILPKLISIQDYFFKICQKNVKDKTYVINFDYLPTYPARRIRVIRLDLRLNMRVNIRLQVNFSASFYFFVKFRIKVLLSIKNFIYHVDI